MSKHLMPFISDKTLYKAVMFSRNMIREGTPAGVANTRAARYYGVKIKDVAHYVGIVGGKIKNTKTKRV